MKNLNDYPIGVVGAGSWGTTLAHMLAEKGYPVTLWVFESELCRALRETGCNSWYLPDTALAPGLVYTNDLREAVKEKQLILWVSPVKNFGELFEQALPHVLSDAIHVSASKGIERQSLQTISQIAAEKAGAQRAVRFAVLSGPSFAKEVSVKMPTAVAVAAHDSRIADSVQQVMATSFFRTYTTNDMMGVEIGGALKNVIALASGICEGLDFGHNTRAALITRGLAEIMRLGMLMGAQARTFSGLSGIGDLVLTCTSTLSRNYRVGVEIGKGTSLDNIMSTMKMIAEGVYTVQSAHSLAEQHKVEMPIVHEIYHVLFDHKPPLQAVKDLMGRDLTKENV
ncbi:MAG: NAD(P)-dependent glycerol-3-phosphate dehydrogenase [Deltaproteobacteria bacterium]|nr:NAD(P)-dependent glycerol-3-phosphate dehydrogenase [Deltaproteobacteria bacterium]